MGSPAGGISGRPDLPATGLPEYPTGPSCGNGTPLPEPTNRI